MSDFVKKFQDAWNNMTKEDLERLKEEVMMVSSLFEPTGCCNQPMTAAIQHRKVKGRTIAKPIHRCECCSVVCKVVEGSVLIMWAKRMAAQQAALAKVEHDHWNPPWLGPGNSYHDSLISEDGGSEIEVTDLPKAQTD